LRMLLVQLRIAISRDLMATTQSRTCASVALPMPASGEGIAFTTGSIKFNPEAPGRCFD